MAERRAVAWPGECVPFVRSRLADRGLKLPDDDNHDMDEWEKKQAIVNVNDHPRAGDVAIIEVSHGPNAVYGHLAMVRDVTEVSIQIEEANWRRGWITVRTSIGDDLQDAISALGIIGFYRDE